MKKLSTRQLLILFMVIDSILFGTYILTNPKKTTSIDLQISESSIQRICELATLDCYYHNVSEWRKPASITSGTKKLWIEYDGIVRAGVNADRLRLSDPDSDNTIIVTIPDATILSMDLDEESIYEIDSSGPLWGFLPIYESVNTEERKEALADAQEDMMASASKNRMILEEARERAKMIIEKNIIAIGEASGKNYKVRFVDADETQTATPSD